MGNGTIRILIVEDVPDVARHLRGLVAEQRDLELLDIVRDGATALARLQELAPDVVVVDSLVRGPVQLHEVLAALRDRGIPAIVIKLEKMKGTADPGQGISAVLSMPFTGYQIGRAHV